MTANHKPYIVGLTGGIASGKSVAARQLTELGALCIDADAISHALTDTDGAVLPDICEAFGPDVFEAEGVINRRALADIIYGDPIARRKLEAILHPAIQREMMDEVERAQARGVRLVFLNVPLLFETGMDALCDETWLISVDPDLQRERLMQRDDITREQAQVRMDAQMSEAEKTERATVIIPNNKTLERMLGEVTAQYNRLLRQLDKQQVES